MLRKMSSKIKHQGVITEIDGRHVKVRIVQHSACSGCKIASHCHASEMKEKTIDVYTDAEGFSAGQEVIVTASQSAVWRALVWGFVCPLVLLVGTLIAIRIATGNEAMAALCSIGVLLPYYTMVWLMRDKLSQVITFQIEEEKSI